MKRRFRLANPSLAMVGGLLCCLLTGCRPDRPRFENAVLIVIDTLRQDRLSCYGYERPTCPTLDRLAASGVLLDGRSPTSWTKPATASLLTGLHPLEHQAIDREDRLSNAVPTLAEALSEDGIFTLGISGNGWVSEKFGLARGFQSFDLVQRKPGPGPSTASELNKVLFKRLENLRSRFFLYVHYVDPHAPYDPPIGWQGDPLPPDVARFAPLDDRRLEMGTFKVRDRALMAAARDLYDGEIRFVDREIGSLLSHLERKGLLKSTLVVVTSDHGEEWEEHGRIGHMKTVYREVVQVPLIFSGKGLPTGLRRGPLSLMEVAPAICSLLGVARCPGEAHGAKGDRIVDFLLGRKGSEADPILYHLDLDGRGALGWEVSGREAILSTGPYRKEWFDLEEDPSQQRNLIGLRSEIRGGSFEDDAARLAETYNALSANSTERTAANVDLDTISQLRALGYLAPGRNSMRRTLPRRIRPADSLPGGTLGWEDLGRASGCVAVLEEGESAQLLEAWSYPEPLLQGRWTEGRATLYLQIPPAGPSRALRIEGITWRPVPYTIELFVHTTSLGKREVSTPGPFGLEFPIVEGISVGPTVVTIDATPPFRPSSLGMADQRTLGTFVRQVCVQGAPNQRM